MLVKGATGSIIIGNYSDSATNKMIISLNCMSYHLYVKYDIPQFFNLICCISPNQYFYAPLLQHICVHRSLIHLDGATRQSLMGIFGSEGDLSPVRCHAIAWTNAGISLFGPLSW